MVHHGATRKGNGSRQKFGLLGRQAHDGQHALPGRDRNSQKRTGFGPHLRIENLSY